MKISIHTPDTSHLLRNIVFQLRNKTAFVKLWANECAKEGAANARKKPGKRWWKDLARSVRMRSVNAETAEVSSDQVGANLKQFGGIVRPVRKRALTIPISDESKGKTAYELEKPDRPLFTWKSKKGNTILGYALQRQKHTELVPLFVLLRKVTAKPDPWFPSANRQHRLGLEVANRLYQKELSQWNSPR